MVRSVSADEPDAIERLTRSGWPDLRHLWNREARGYPPIEKNKNIVLTELEIIPRKVWPGVAFGKAGEPTKIDVIIKVRDLREPADTEYHREMTVTPEFLDVTGTPAGKMKVDKFRMEMWVDGEYSCEILPDKVEERSFTITDSRMIESHTDHGPLYYEKLGSEIKLLKESRFTAPIDELMHEIPKAFEMLKDMEYEVKSVSSWDDPASDPLADIRRYAIMVEDKEGMTSMMTDADLRKRLAEMAAADRARLETETLDEKMYREEYMREKRTEELSRLHREGKLKYEPTHPTRAKMPFPRPAATARRCDVSINEATGKVSCACWTTGRQWCEAMDKWLTSTASSAITTLHNQEMRALGGRSPVSGSVLLPIAPGYCLMRVDLGHRANGDSRIPGVVVMTDASNHDLTIDLSRDNADTVSVALDMFRRYYRMFPEFDNFNLVVQKIHNFQVTTNPEIKSANRVNKNPFGCTSPMHGVMSDRQLMEAIIKPPYGVTLENIVLGNVYSIRAMRLCVHCNPENYDFSTDVP